MNIIHLIRTDVNDYNDYKKSLHSINTKLMTHVIQHEHTEGDGPKRNQMKRRVKKFINPFF